MRSSPVIWTIGHSNHTFERFAELLGVERIDVVVDVRSYPYSRIAPQFNREELGGALRGAGARYLFFGKELGGRPSDEGEYDEHGHARYDRMAERPTFRMTVQRLLSGCQEHRIALLCSEGQPQECHRRLLVGKVLADHGVQLRHIPPNGAVHQESTVALDSGDGQETLFAKEAAWRSTRSVSHRRLRLNEEHEPAFLSVTDVRFVEADHKTIKTDMAADLRTRMRRGSTSSSCSAWRGPLRGRATITIAIGSK